MEHSYLEVTFRRGRPLAAYLYLPRRGGEKVARTRRVEPGMVVDYGRDGRPLGIEITSPGAITLPAINRLLRGLGRPPLKKTDLAPLVAA